MATIKESLSRIRTIFKAVNEDVFMTDRFIYSIVLKHSKALIRRQDNESKLMRFDSLFETLPFVELIEVDKIEADCAGLKTGCKIMRTKKKLPKVMTGSLGPLFRNVGPIDYSNTFQQINQAIYIAMTNSTNFKYNKNHYFWYKNGYLYFPDISWDAVTIEAMFEESTEEFCNENNTSCLLMQDKELSIPEYLFTEIESLVQQELMTLAKIPGDASDNSQNILR